MGLVLTPEYSISPVPKHAGVTGAVEPGGQGRPCSWGAGGGALHAGLVRRPDPQKRAEGAAFTQFGVRRGHRVGLTVACSDLPRSGQGGSTLGRLVHLPAGVLSNKMGINFRSPAKGRLFRETLPTLNFS